MCVHVSMSVNMYLHVCVLVSVSVHMYLHVCACERVCTYVSTCVCVSVSVHTCELKTFLCIDISTVNISVLENEVIPQSIHCGYIKSLEQRSCEPSK